MKAHDVNCTPWSACTIPPAAGWRFLMAMSRALTTRFESCALSIDQPTIFFGEGVHHGAAAQIKTRQNRLTQIGASTHGDVAVRGHG